MAEKMTNKEVFFSGLAEAFKEQRHTDVLLKPGDNGDAIPAHKVVLVARSKVFGNILESDAFKSSVNETITLSEMNRGELEVFLEFLYTGTLPVLKLGQHAKSLYRAADKYDIPYLQELCRNHFIASLSSSNALDVLELSDNPLDKALKAKAMDFIIEHMEQIASSLMYEWFVENNPKLAVQITRQFLSKIKAKKKADSFFREQTTGFSQPDRGQATFFFSASQGRDDGFFSV